MSNDKIFKVDDIVSIDLRPRYKKLLLGVVVNVFNEQPNTTKELAYGVPWDGPYPIVGCYIPSIVGNERGDNGYYWRTADQIKEGLLKHSSKMLEAPPTKFRVGDTIARKVYWVRDVVIGVVQELPSIKNALLTVKWDSHPYIDKRVKETDIVHLFEAKEQLARLKDTCDKNATQVEMALKSAITAITFASDLMKKNGTTLDVYLSAKPDTRGVLNGVLYEHLKSIINE